MELLLAFEVVESGENVERKVLPLLLAVLALVAVGALFYIRIYNRNGLLSIGEYKHMHFC